MEEQSTALWGWGWEQRSSEGGPGWRQALCFPDSSLHKTCLLGKVLVSHCPAGRSRARVMGTCTHVLLGGVGKDWKDTGKFFHNDEVRENQGPQLNQAGLESHRKMSDYNFRSF